MDNILHDPKDPKLWELWYIPYYGSCMICPSTVGSLRGVGRRGGGSLNTEGLNSANKISTAPYPPPPNPPKGPYDS